MSIFDKFTRENEEEEKIDLFEQDYRTRRPKEPKQPEPSPDNPSYWEKEESKWEHLRPTRRRAVWMWLGGSLLIIILLIAFWMRYFSPYVDDAVEYGYIEHIEKRGSIFKTYEGVLIRYKELHDTTRLYTRDFVFTASDADVATNLKRMEIAHKPVRVSYRRYHATLPWRGASKIIVTAVDSVDPRSILPPEYSGTPDATLSAAY